MENQEGVKKDFPQKISFKEWQRQRGKGQRTPLDERMKNSRYLFFRLLYTFGKSVAAIFIAVGGFLAWLISLFLL